MSSIYRDSWEKEAKEEVAYLLSKRREYGWTQVDADRYNSLVRDLGEQYGEQPSL